ncbi:hypothetical protein ACNKHV_25775 [Shigella flexneri]
MNIPGQRHATRAAWFYQTPAGRFYHDDDGETVCTDMGIERTSLGSLLDHTGAFGESEKYAARVFGADRSWSVVVGLPALTAPSCRLA